MRLLLALVFFWIPFLIFGQVICSESLPSGGFTDEPPGCLFCGNILNGTNDGFTADAKVVDFPCGEVENSLWFSIQSGTQRFFDISAVVRNCNSAKGLEMAIYDSDYNLVSNCTKLIEGTTANGQFGNIEPNSLYHLMIDGVDGDICDFGILIDKGTRITPRLATDQVRNTLCLGAEVCYIVSSAGENAEIQWNLPPEDSLIAGGGLSDTTACIYFQTEGAKKVEAIFNNSCFPNRKLTDELIVEGPEESIKIDQLFTSNKTPCIGEEVTFSFNWEGADSMRFFWQNSFFEVLEGGGELDTFMRTRFLTSGFQWVSAEPLTPCGLRTLEQINVPDSPSSIQTLEICADDCYQLGDSCYQANGLHFANFPSDHPQCDSTVILDLISRSIFPSPSTTCEGIENGLLIKWMSIADSFKISINRSTEFFTKQKEILLEDVAFDSMVNVKIQPIGSCVFLPAEITCANNTTVSTSETNKLECLKIYPNPTNGQISIKTDLKIERIEIFDPAGRLVQKEKLNSFQIHNRVEGVYFLKITTTKGITVKRILVQ